MNESEARVLKTKTIPNIERRMGTEGRLAAVGARLGASILVLAAHLLLPSAAIAAVQTNLVAMRDGVKLATDVYLPDGDGPWPVIFLRFPYNKALGAGV